MNSTTRRLNDDVTLHRYCASRDIMFAVCRLVSQDHVMKALRYLCVIYKWKLLKISHHLPKLSDTGDMIIWSLDQSNLRLYGYKNITLSYHPARFSGHRHSASGDIIFFVYHSISQDQVLKESCGVTGGSFS